MTRNNIFRMVLLSFLAVATDFKGWDTGRMCLEELLRCPSEAHPLPRPSLMMLPCWAFSAALAARLLEEERQRLR